VLPKLFIKYCTEPKVKYSPLLALGRREGLGKDSGRTREGRAALTAA
jgi:hypothetical protein